MDLFVWRRGPLQKASIIIFAACVAWRLWSFLRMSAERVSAAPARKAFGAGDALGAAFAARAFFVLQTTAMRGVK